MSIIELADIINLLYELRLSVQYTIFLEKKNEQVVHLMKQRVYEKTPTKNLSDNKLSCKNDKCKHK
jgi:hypothetical protein